MDKEKKEIGIEKLIELLNEYEKTLEPNLQIEWTEVGIKSTPEIVISKKFGFIKWLVDNDKIDLDNEELISLMSELGERRNPVKCLIMLLSIQENPIRFLYEILK